MLLKERSTVNTESEPEYLDGLNEPQREAVLHVEGPLLVLAGAGTGKTKVLTTRIAHLLLQKHALSGQILSTTFTNKAAREMRERVEHIVGQPTDGMWMGTFHSLCGRILRRHAELVGLSSRFIIIDADDQVRLVKQLLQEYGIDDKKFAPRIALSIIQSWKDRALMPDKVGSNERGDFADGKMAMLYREYQERLKRSDAVDFGDLILYSLDIFTRHPDVLEEYSRRFHYILVDEYQDTNVAQYLWLRLLAMAHKNICCVGDDDQSIYGWRGAEVGNILRFEKDFSGAHVVRLEQNYRSTSHILAAASAVIANNSSRHGKTLWCEGDGGEKIIVRNLWDDSEEARYVGETVEDLQRKQIPLNNMAILVRAGFQTRAFEERLITLGVPYKVVGGLRFYERQEIRDVIAYLRLIYQPNDSLALQRIINLPKRGLGSATLESLNLTARDQQCSLYQAIQMLMEQNVLKPRVAATLRTLFDLFADWHKQAEVMEPADLVEDVLERSGYRAMWKLSKDASAASRLDNLKELIRAVAAYDRLEDFLEHVSLVMDMEVAENDDMVSVMTMHAAKGLEYDAVFLPGWEEGIFPSSRSLDESGVKGLEEERRLAYVGITRARRHLWITHASNRRIYNQWQNSLPSRFIGELPAAHVENEEAPARSQSSFGGGSWKQSVDKMFDTARRERSATPPKRISDVVPSKLSNCAIPVGSRVFHKKFGYGKVIGGQGERLDVMFEKAGIKKVMQDYIEKA